MGSALFAAMYMGRPEALSGEVFKPGWLKKVRLMAGKNDQGEDDFGVLIDGEFISMDELLTIQFWDLAISLKETADYTACCTLAFHAASKRLIILSINRARRTFDGTQKEIEREGEFWRPYAVGIEKVAYQAAATQEAIRNTMLPIRELKADHDKVTRARLPAALAEAGKVYYVEADWNEAFLDELLEFPNGRHDDQVDALSGAAAIAQTYYPSSFYLWDNE